MEEVVHQSFRTAGDTEKHGHMNVDVPKGGEDRVVIKTKMNAATLAPTNVSMEIVKMFPEVTTVNVILDGLANFVILSTVLHSIATMVLA